MEGGGPFLTLVAKVGDNLGPAFDAGDDRWDAKPRLGQSYACPKVPIRDLPKGLIPDKYFLEVENNQKRDALGNLDVQPCCREIRKHGSIEAWYSAPADRTRRIPDIYVMTCGECNRLHRRQCVGGSIGSGAYPEYRPFWPTLEPRR